MTNTKGVTKPLIAVVLIAIMAFTTAMCTQNVNAASKPSTPKNVRLGYLNPPVDGHNASVKWDKVKNAKSYTVQYYGRKGGLYKRNCKSAFFRVGLLKGEKIKVRVKSNNSKGSSKYTAWKTLKYKK